MFKYTLDNKRYHTLNYFLKEKYGSKVFKIPLDAGFSCPNMKSGGCIYCKDNSSASITDKNDSLLDQFYKNKEILHRKWPEAKYIGYFQAGSNTYADISNLKEVYELILKQDNVIGLSIATRPDCITDEVLNYLEDINKRTFLTIELGLQSSNDETLKLINRGHTKLDFENTVKRLQKANIFTVAHIINSLPFETEIDMINTAKYVNKLNVNGVKIHMLYISEDTKMSELYKDKNFHVLSKDEYIDITIKQLRNLNENIVIERITGDPVKEELIAPDWLLKKFCLLNDIDKEMVKQDVYQGDNC